MKEYQKCAREMLDFIEKSPTCFQAVANLKADLEGQGFQELFGEFGGRPLLGSFQREKSQVGVCFPRILTASTV